LYFWSGAELCRTLAAGADVAVTLHDVAIRAGVSIKTVSQVVNGHAQVSPSTRHRVLAVVEELGYQPNLSARSLRSGRTHVISLIIPTLRNAYFAELGRRGDGGSDRIRPQRPHEQVNGTRASELAALHGPRGQGVDGLLYSALELGEADEPVLEGIDLPLGAARGDRMFNTTRDHVTMPERGRRQGRCRASAVARPATHRGPWRPTGRR
jgi:hypothetical protein